jgi:hypothetical protein
MTARTTQAALCAESVEAERRAIWGKPPVAEVILEAMRDLHKAHLEYEAVKRVDDDGSDETPAMRAFWRRHDAAKLLAALLRGEGIDPRVIGAEL